MAFPWIFEANFSGGTNGEWDSESDTGSKLSFPHYSDLARLPWAECAPYRGAYCGMIDLRTGDTNDHTLTEGDIDIADAATRYFRFYLWLAPDFAATADDSFNILELQQADGTRECSMGLRITAATDAVEIGIGDGVAPSSYAASTLTKGEWHCIEWKVKISTTGAGTQDLYVDGSSSLVALTTLTNAAAVAQGVLGTQDTVATTTGVILLDCFAMDDAQIYPFRERYPRQMHLTKSNTVFVGPGWIDSATLLTTGASNTMYLFDTDTANVNDAQGMVVELDLTTHTSAEGPFFFQRGCYCQLSGTNPRGQVQLVTASDEPGIYGPITYGNVANLRRYGRHRKQRQVANV